MIFSHNGLRMKTDISPDDLTNVIDVLLDEEQRMKIDSDKNSTTTAFMARGNKSGITCTHCSKTGHPVEKCWEKNPELKPKRFRGGKKPDGEDTASAGGTAETTPDTAAAFQTHRISAFKTHVTRRSEATPGRQHRTPSRQHRTLLHCPSGLCRGP